ncbi:site-specific integrase [Sediminicola luteus]|uniref:Tyr recombinase domain-containing protein n=1 Tax=Sediminicola luteus TaxID=319238 RepID=A0A2A4G3W3_9FLAO|nr:site-specific integrase [Sediminicola luteus]PCE63113.1 hypothetical protein B7P33_17750 [Sediminicola luteus]
MKANNSFSLLFYPRISDLDKNGKATLFLRITVDGKRAELSLKRKVNPKTWCPISGKIKEKGLVSKEINDYIDELKVRVRQFQGDFVIKGQPYTASTIKSCLVNKGADSKTVLNIYDEHNSNVRELLGKDFTYGTYRRHIRTRNHLSRFIQKEFGKIDYFVQDVDLAFINRFDIFLRKNGAGGHNTITKYVTNFKKIVRVAFANNWISTDPFFHWKAKWVKTEREVLTERELQVLIKTEFKLERLNRTRDIFVFCCFTGLSYIDVKKLTLCNIVFGLNGKKWITILRTKTKVKSTIPLLPLAERILEKYSGYTSKHENVCLLPVYSNQKLNKYLKEISTLCQINKRVTFHLSRHTFATTVTLANGVPIESVSKMLGHQSIRTTQIYAKVLDKKLFKDMEQVISRYESI